MPTLQVITIKPDGSAHSLVHKRGQGLDLRDLGTTRTTRATLIEPDEGTQRWRIRWEEDGPSWNKGDYWERGTFAMAGLEFEDVPGAEGWPTAGLEAPFAYFRDYEDAVAAEVRVIQEFQRRGIYTF